MRGPAIVHGDEFRAIGRGGHGPPLGRGSTSIWRPGPTRIAGTVNPIRCAATTVYCYKFSPVGRRGDGRPVGIWRSDIGCPRVAVVGRGVNPIRGRGRGLNIDGNELRPIRR